MKITVNNLKKLVKKLVRPDENSGKEKDTFEAALKRARDEAKYNLTEELREKYADFLDSPIKEKCILYEAFGGRGMTCSPHAIFNFRSISMSGSLTIFRIMNHGWDFTGMIQM